jgi:hypothetical protein
VGSVGHLQNTLTGIALGPHQACRRVGDVAKVDRVAVSEVESSFATVTRSSKLDILGPCVVSKTVLVNSASIKLLSISVASRRLKSYSGTFRALVDVEQPLYEATALLNAASLLHRCEEP